jgi:hypothetical protein
MISTWSRTCSGKFRRTASLTPTMVVPEQFVGPRRGLHQRALPRLVHEDAVLHVDRRARQVRDSLDEVE